MIIPTSGASAIRGNEVRQQSWRGFCRGFRIGVRRCGEKGSVGCWGRRRSQGLAGKWGLVAVARSRWKAGARAVARGRKVSLGSEGLWGHRRSQFSISVSHSLSRSLSPSLTNAAGGPCSGCPAGTPPPLRDRKYEFLKEKKKQVS